MREQEVGSENAMKTVGESGDEPVSEATQSNQQTRMLQIMPRILVARSRSASRGETAQSASDAWRAVERMAKGLGKKLGVAREQQSLRSLKGERDEVMLPEAVAFPQGGNASIEKNTVRLIYLHHLWMVGPGLYPICQLQVPLNWRVLFTGSTVLFHQAGRMFNRRQQL